jgi:hypothetical protein
MEPLLDVGLSYHNSGIYNYLRGQQHRDPHHDLFLRLQEDLFLHLVYSWFLI